MITLYKTRIIQVNLPDLRADRICLRIISGTANDIIQERSLCLMLVHLIRGVEIQFSLLIRIRDIFRYHKCKTKFSLPYRILPDIDRIRVICVREADRISFFIRIIAQGGQ